ncbi:MAG: redox-sensing transcriptional repressor Rex [Elusimicrobiota bacterium]|jgi:redox-sensing transcriptional repressor|nr:redox-sensing transcriptional repressor Rex [Elusimicrobiota bacterium]
MVSKQISAQSKNAVRAKRGRKAARRPAPELAIRRLLIYLDYLKSLGADCVSSGQIADNFGFTAIQVRKDIACAGFSGRPKRGYNRAELIKHIENFLGFYDKMDAFLVGAGNIGRALASYGGFAKYSLNIIAACDINPQLHGTEINGKKIFSVDKAVDLIKRLKIKLAIIAVPSHQSQPAADLLIKAGIKAIWNFSSARLSCPPDIIVQNEDLGASLSVLSQKLLAAQTQARK